MDCDGLAELGLEGGSRSLLDGRGNGAVRYREAEYLLAARHRGSWWDHYEIEVDRAEPKGLAFSADGSFQPGPFPAAVYTHGHACMSDRSEQF